LQSYSGRRHAARKGFSMDTSLIVEFHQTPSKHESTKEWSEMITVRKTQVEVAFDK
jgi:hypothetical protein